MARTDSEDEAEASGSRSRAAKRRRSTPAHTPTPVMTDPSRNVQSQAAPSSRRRKRNSSPEPSQRKSQEMAAHKNRKDKNKKNGDRSTAAAAASASLHLGNPRGAGRVKRWRRPQPHLAANGMPPLRPHLWSALPCDGLWIPPSSREKHAPKLTRPCLPGLDLRFKYREKKKNGGLMAKSSGLLIDWDEQSKMGTILTSALLIRTKHSSIDQWLATDEYAPNAEVWVHLLDRDETIAPAHLLQYDKNFNLALFTVPMESTVKIPSFNSEVLYGQDVFVLGRDKNLNLNVNYGSVQFKGPTMYERHHYMFVGCKTSQYGVGGPVIDLHGQVLGLANVQGMGFIPSSIILKCLDMWKKFNCVPRLHMGMKFSAMKLMDLAHVEKITRKCNITSGLIVKQVAYGLVAEKSGIRVGDIIASMNGKCIATTVDLEKSLLLICENQLDKDIDIGSCVEIPIDVFHTRKGSTRTINLRLKISDEVEVFDKGDYLVSARDCA